MPTENTKQQRIKAQLEKEETIKSLEKSKFTSFVFISLQTSGNRSIKLWGSSTKKNIKTLFLRCFQ